ncbi:MAG: DUF2490 domain-containing protein [Bacteroidota bacterium]
MKLPFLSLLLLAGVMTATAQTTDLKLWNSYKLSADLSKRWSADLEQQLRFNNNITTFDFALTELSVSYKINKHFDVAGGLRYSYLENNPTESVDSYDRLRWMADLKFDTDVFKTDLKFNLRLRYQESRDVTAGLSPDRYLRARCQLEYNLSKLVDPELSYELYYKFGQPGELRAHRISAGASWRIIKKLYLDTSYIYQWEINVKNPDFEHIVSVGIKYKL